MAFWNLTTIDLEQFRPGILSKAHIGDGLIMACLEIGPAMEDAGHEHPFDQCGIVLEGKIQMFVGEDVRVLNASDAYFIPAGQRHGWKTFGKPVRILDVSRKA